MNVERFGDNAWLITFTDAARARSASHYLSALFPTVRFRPGMSSLLIQDATDEQVVHISMALQTQTGTDVAHAGKVLDIAVHYTGEDLHWVADQLGWTVADVIAAHTGSLWTVALVGFAPGFPYLLPTSPKAVELASVPRLSVPRTSVPAGSVAVAAGMSSIYPQSMPGGWALLGATTATLFDVAATPPNLLAVGDKIQFVQVQP